jgi:hypothetical protein
MWDMIIISSKLLANCSEQQNVCTHIANVKPFCTVRARGFQVITVNVTHRHNDSFTAISLACRRWQS